MTFYALRRLVLLVPVLLGVTLVTFALTRVIPGNPINQLISPLASPAERASLIHQHGLDQPFYVQYVDYVRDLLHGDLGTSFTTSQPVLHDLTSRFGATFELTLYAMLVALVVGVPLGIAAAVRQGRLIDHVSRILAVSGIALPVFWTSLTLLYIFFLRLHVLPAPYGRIDPSIQPPRHLTGLLTVDSLLTGDWTALRSSAEALILPVGVLAFGVMAPIARITRSGMLEALESDYVRAARSLGLPERTVVLRHAFRNATLPLITMVAVVYGYLLGGVVLVEQIFAWPGLGRYVFNAITSSDYPSVQGFILYATTIYVLLFLVVDLLYLAIDPRIRTARAKA
ncbi:MAG TPA: ABC transporter permease [Gaiellaceae bacterium]|nr:ABC transporter permease [Gaiellaceae bacterium]